MSTSRGTRNREESPRGVREQLLVSREQQGSRPPWSGFLIGAVARTRLEDAREFLLRSLPRPRSSSSRRIARTVHRQSRAARCSCWTFARSRRHSTTSLPARSQFHPPPPPRSTPPTSGPENFPNHFQTSRSFFYRRRLTRVWSGCGRTSFRLNLPRAEFDHSVVFFSAPGEGREAIEICRAILIKPEMGSLR